MCELSRFAEIMSIYELCACGHGPKGAARRRDSWGHLRPLCWVQCSTHVYQMPWPQPFKVDREEQRRLRGMDGGLRLLMCPDGVVHEPWWWGLTLRSGPSAPVVGWVVLVEQQDWAEVLFFFTVKSFCWLCSRSVNVRWAQWLQEGRWGALCL